jgi:ribose 5-phosphate isomerase B
MKVYLASDHAGFELKEAVKKFLQQENFEVEDCGALTFNKTDDYPDYISQAAAAVAKDQENSRAIIFGRSGQAEAMLANKYPGVRAALFYIPAVPLGAADVTGRISHDPLEMIRLTREHNNANVLSLGATFLRKEDALKVVKMWLDSPFTREARHVRRLDKIKQIEEELYDKSRH